MAKIIHMMQRVRDLDRSMAFYRTAFAMTESHRLDFPTFTLVYLRGPQDDFEIELTLNKDRGEPYTHGDGYGHVAFCVDDLEAEHRRLQEFGLAPGDLKELSRDGQRLARFFFITDPDGYKIEVLQRAGHYV